MTRVTQRQGEDIFCVAGSHAESGGVERTGKMVRRRREPLHLRPPLGTAAAGDLLAVSLCLA